MKKSLAWYKFQEEIKEHFISIGADAKTNITIQGIRTSHDIDVYVKNKFLGENMIWLVEAKYWKSKVSKSHVLAFRSIIEDIGADRGFLVSSSGFQRGAIEAAKNTNVKLKSLSEMKAETREFVEIEVIKTYKKRLRLIEERYWSHSKSTRIKYGLRTDILDYSLSFIGQQMLVIARDALMSAEHREYPIDLETHLKEQQGDSKAHNFQQLCNWLNLNLNHFEEKLLTAEWEMYKNGEYQPDTIRTPDSEQTTTERMANMFRLGRKNLID
ncbi:restriction endonuclease [Pseudomonas oryzihabitans]|uniref:restriction endonuclease n=1 Tax=Pseudomonas oryzihabitans TaxID=47885 RepID=UPI002894EDA2|nr:restriction endonuclease [Pseudomonas oryzihabitans]MDT3718264.1 restriction endonuclease [Pseudomonas oryzihabitans]